MTPIPHGSSVGILGAGQLGRMLAMAAARLGYVPKIYAPERGPAGQVAEQTVGPWDGEGLDAFARACAVVTYEAETVPLEAIDRVGAVTSVRPGRRAQDIARDRLKEKDFLTGLGLRTARYRGVKDAEALAHLVREIGPDTILKTRRMGYDGRGQVRLRDGDDAARAIRDAGNGPLILEAVVEFAFEASVIVARAVDGSVACYDVAENRHEQGILRASDVPSRMSAMQAAAAQDIAGRIVDALGYVGVMGVELFVTDDAILVNEIAPRVHNSGHWTQAVCAVDQFERHIRAIAGLPLGDGTRRNAVRMVNLIGPEGMAALGGHLSEVGAQVHLYGKDVRAGRKLGHVNIVS